MELEAGGGGPQVGEVTRLQNFFLGSLSEGA